MAEGEASVLTLLIENNEAFWEGLDDCGELTAHAFLEQILTFIRAFTLLHDSNQLAVFSVGADSTSLLCATSGCTPTPPTPHGNTPSTDATDIAELTLQRLRQASAQRVGGARQAAAWGSALLRAMCLVNKQRHAIPSGQPAPSARFLCIKCTPDDSSQYLAFMNAVFAAQRAHVTIDALILGEHQSSFMQQACHLTGGIYLKPAKPEALVEYLMTAFAADSSSREFLRLPKPSSVDFRAACFCHKRPTAQGYVCSVCLSIFCHKVDACSTCGTEYPLS